MQDWYINEEDMFDMEGFDEPDPDSDYDYEESYRKKKKRNSKPARGSASTDSPHNKKAKVRSWYFEGVYLTNVISAFCICKSAILDSSLLAEEGKRKIQLYTQIHQTLRNLLAVIVSQNILFYLSFSGLINIASL